MKKQKKNNCTNVYRRQVGDGVVLFTKEIEGPPAIYEYWVESISFKKLIFTFDFEGSENFTIAGTRVMQVTVNAEPNAKSQVVRVQQVDIYQGGSLSMGMSWVRKDPDPSTLKAHIDASQAKINDHITKGRTLFSVIDGKSVTEIEALSKKAGISFIDVTFPPTTTSLFACDTKDEGAVTNHSYGSGFAMASEVLKPLAIEWRRPVDFQEASKPYVLFEGNIEPNDIKQGALGDCWFMCALSSIAEFDTLVKELFLQEEVSPQGVYQIRLCKNGNWITVTVDDYFPCRPQGGPVYSQGHGPELWVLLLEKAFAKVHGSYHQIKGGWPFEAMMDLTGSPYKDIRFADKGVQDQISDGSLFDYLLDCDINNFIMSCSTAGEDHFTESGGKPVNNIGLVPGHAYTLISVVKTKREGHRLCQIRNPWGNFEWTGDWSDNSPLWTPALRKECKMVVADDGLFWMSFEDLVKNFTGISVAMVRHPGLNHDPWHEVRSPFTYNFGREGKGVEHVSMYELNVPEQGDLYFTVHQQDKRCLGAPNYLDLGLTLLKPKGNNEFDFIATSGNSAERQNQIEVKNLKPGKYLLVPTSTCCKMMQHCIELRESGKSITSADLVRLATLSVHSTNHFSLTEVPFNSFALEEAMELPVIRAGAQTDLFADGTFILYTLKSGYAGVSFVGQNKDTVPLVLTMDFTGSNNIISSRGKLIDDILIPPGEAKVLHHISPLHDDKGWSYTWSCDAREATDEDVATLST